MTTVLSYSVLHRMGSVGGLPWKFLKPQHILQKNRSRVLRLPYGRMFHQRVCCYSSAKAKLGPEGQNPPEKFDGGDYDELKNQEYEEDADRRAKNYRRIKKIASSVLFVSVLGYVGYSRRTKRQEIASNMEAVKVLKDDGLFQGSEKQFCEYQLSENETSRKVILPLSIVKDGTIKKLKSLKLNKDDVVVASFPKAGCTWVQEIVYLISNDLDFKKAQSQVLETRFPYMEYPYPGLSSIEKSSSPRLLKTHLPYENLPESIDQAKVIYVTRNPKDLVVSYYHFVRMLTMFNFVGSFEDFAEKFRKDELPYCPFFDHVESYTERQENGNILIVSFEELSKHPEENVQKIGSFLGKQLTNEEIREIVEYTRFENMANNPSVNYEHWDELGFRNKNESKFMRKGKVADWKNYFQGDINASFDDWIGGKNAKLRYPFVYEQD